MTDTKPETIVYRPADVAELTLKTIAQRETTRDRGVILGIKAVDDILLPMRPGELVTVLALSSNWKTGLMQYVARRTAESLDPSGDECVLFVTWEIAIEEAGILDLASATQIDLSDIAQGKITDWASLKNAAVKRGTLPVYLIGHSIERRKQRPALTMTNVAKAVLYLEDRLKLRVRLACLDYLQRIEWEGVGEPRIQYSRNVDRCKDMALAIGAPVMLGCQAKQEIMERDWKLPRMNDGMETSNVMHSSDKIIGLWRPIVTEGPDSQVGPAGGRIPVTDDLMLMGIAKQRFGRVGDWFPLSVDVARNNVRGLMELHRMEDA